ncbi:uncharacterized protein A4U43_C08F110 [Asparagus officinalis]|nr:uncharacterized protein A4U43_C08F110 [Asparagus officinalis]
MRRRIAAVAAVVLQPDVVGPDSDGIHRSRPPSCSRDRPLHPRDYRLLPITRQYTSCCRDGEVSLELPLEFPD